jgi:hypothetical protein
LGSELYTQHKLAAELAAPVIIGPDTIALILSELKVESLRRAQLIYNQGRLSGFEETEARQLAENKFYTFQLEGQQALEGKLQQLHTVYRLTLLGNLAAGDGVLDSRISKKELKKSIKTLSRALEEDLCKVFEIIEDSTSIARCQSENNYKESKYVNNLGSKHIGDVSVSSNSALSLHVCLCKQPYDSRFYYVTCNVCNNIFHGVCIGIDKVQGNQIVSYVCDRCCKSTKQETQYLSKKRKEVSSPATLTTPSSINESSRKKQRQSISRENRMKNKLDLGNGTVQPIEDLNRSEISVAEEDSSSINCTKETIHSVVDEICPLCSSSASGKSIICCESCLHWFHLACVAHTEVVYSFPPSLDIKPFFCSDCKDVVSACIL